MALELLLLYEDPLLLYDCESEDLYDGLVAGVLPAAVPVCPLTVDVGLR